MLQETRRPAATLAVVSTAGRSRTSDQRSGGERDKGWEAAELRACSSGRRGRARPRDDAFWRRPRPAGRAWAGGARCGAPKLGRPFSLPPKAPIPSPFPVSAASPPRRPATARSHICLFCSISTKIRGASIAEPPFQLGLHVSRGSCNEGWGQLIPRDVDGDGRPPTRGSSVRAAGDASGAASHRAKCHPPWRRTGLSMPPPLI